MSAPANVLAVIDAVISELRTIGETGHVQNLMDAHAASAELIAAANKIRLEYTSDQQAYVYGLARLVEALARVGGAV